jgi:hypothetical protein
LSVLSRSRARRRRGRGSARRDLSAVGATAKTLADCFKYRNKIGLDVALEALREAWRRRRLTMDELDHYAAICRVQRVMRLYLEALTA